jgi:tRNA nucleotidyltransferase (CCA-adding enzyme)
VIKLNTAYGEELDITIPRRETKTGTGHTGFEIEPDPFMTVKEAMERRDFTFNAIGYDPLTTDILDPYNGANDLKNRLLRPVSNRFKEDPLRVIRAMQFAGRFNLHTTPELNSMSQEVKSSFKELAAERVFQEWRKWAVKSTHPSKGLDVLDQTGWLEHFPELQALKNCPQDPKWHPEGDVFTHTKHCCDALAELDFFKNSSPDQKEILMLTILGHDFGKPAKTKKNQMVESLHTRTNQPAPHP